MARRADHMHAVGITEVAVGIGEHEQLAAAGAHFLHVRFHFFQQRVVGRDHHYRHVGIDQGQRAVLELASRIRFGVDIGNLLELERALQCDRVMQTATQEQSVLLGREFVRPSRDLRFEVERVLHATGQVAQRFEKFVLFRGIKPTLQLGQRAGQREQRDQLGGESLGRGDADLGAGARVEHHRAGARNRALRYIADR